MSITALPCPRIVASWVSVPLGAFRLTLQIDVQTPEGLRRLGFQTAPLIKDFKYRVSTTGWVGPAGEALTAEALYEAIGERMAPRAHMLLFVFLLRDALQEAANHPVDEHEPLTVRVADRTVRVAVDKRMTGIDPAQIAEWLARADLSADLEVRLDGHQICEEATA